MIFINYKYTNKKYSNILQNVEISKRIAGLRLMVLLFVAFFMFTGAQPLYAWNLQDAFGSNKDISTDNPLGEVGAKVGYNVSQREIDPIITAVISIVVGLLGVIFLALMIYGGYSWMTARGNEEAVKTAQRLIVGAVIGLLLVVAAYAITYYVLYRVGGLLQ